MKSHIFSILFGLLMAAPSLFGQQYFYPVGGPGNIYLPPPQYYPAPVIVVPQPLYYYYPSLDFHGPKFA